MNKLKRIIDECVRKALYEGVFDKTATPHLSKTDASRTLGINPLSVDNGGHASRDKVLQPSTIDPNGANFDGEHIFVSDNKFMIYKVKNFGNPDIKDTLQFFGNTKELRRAIDIVNGAAKRGYMSKTFWEFSFDGNEWYILKPNPVQTLKISKFSR